METTGGRDLLKRKRAKPPERPASAPGRPATGSIAGSGTRRSSLVGILAMVVIAVALYAPGFRNGFAYDAVMLVEKDPRVHTLDHPLRLLASSYWPGGEETLALYRPVVTLSFAADWALHDGAPWGFHLSNALAHALASALVLLLLSGLVSPWAALAGAALFAVHPVHAEAVASIVGRADILAAAFSFAALLAWSRLAPRGGAARISIPVFFLLALGAKESAVVLPGLLVLWDAATGRLRRGSLGSWARDRAAPLAAMVLVALLYLAARVAVLGGFAPQSLNPIMAAVPPGGTRLRSALQIWPEILRLLLVPKVLLADYGPRILLPAVSWTPRALAGLGILVLSVSGGVWALLRRRGRLGLVLLWAPVALLPVSNLLVPIGVLLAERTLYLAVFALALGAALALDAAGARGWRALGPALGVCAVVGVLFAARTAARLPSWASTDEVFRTLLRDRPDSYRAHWHHARMAWRDGDLASALAFYQSTIELWRYARPVFLEAGMFASETGQEAAARAFAEEALQQWPDDSVFLRRLAVACLNLADTAAAKAAMERGLRVVPDDPLLLMMRADLGGSPTP